MVESVDVANEDEVAEGVAELLEVMLAVASSGEDDDGELEKGPAIGREEALEGGCITAVGTPLMVVVWAIPVIVAVASVIVVGKKAGSGTGGMAAGAGGAGTAPGACAPGAAERAGAGDD